MWKYFLKRLNYVDNDKNVVMNDLAQRNKMKVRIFLYSLENIE